MKPHSGPSSTPVLGRVWTLLPLAVLAGCGGGDEQETLGAAPVDAPGLEAISTEVNGETSRPTAVSEPVVVRSPLDPSTLVPDNATAYFVCDSLDALEETLTRIANLSDSIPAGKELANMPLVHMGVDPELVDPMAPIALALAPVGSGEESAPVLIVPGLGQAPLAMDRSALVDFGRRIRKVEDGSGYYVIDHVGHSKACGGDLRSVTAQLPGLPLRGRFDVKPTMPVVSAKLVAIARSLNEAYALSQPGASSSSLFCFDADWLLNRADAHEQIAIGLGFNGDQMEVAGRTFGSGAEDDEARVLLASELAEVARLGADSDTLAITTSVNPANALEELLAGWAMLTSGTEADLFPMNLGDSGATDPIMAGAVEIMLESCRNAATVTVELEPAKGHVAIYLASRHPESAREAVSLMLSKCELEASGFELALPIRTKIGQTLVEDFGVRFDTRRFDFDARARMRESFKTFLGDSALHLKVATTPEHILIVLGGDTAAVNSRIQSFATETELSTNAAIAMEHIGPGGPGTRTANARMIQSDLVQLLGQLGGLSAIAKGHSVAETHRSIVRSAGDLQAPVTVWSSVLSGGYSFGATMQVQSLRRAFDAFLQTGL